MSNINRRLLTPHSWSRCSFTSSFGRPCSMQLVSERSKKRHVQLLRTKGPLTEAVSIDSQIETSERHPSSTMNHRISQVST